MDISAWLRGLGLERYEQAFRENAIDEATLPKLTAEDLRDLGVTAVGHRRILLDAIAALRAETFRDTTERSVEPDRFRRQSSGSRAPPAHGDVLRPCRLDSASARLDPEDLREIIGAYHRCCAEVIAKSGGFVAEVHGRRRAGLFRLSAGARERCRARGARGARLGRGRGQARCRQATALRVRVGIATGLVVVGDLIGEGAAQEQAVVGETPNLAARLQGACRAGHGGHRRQHPPACSAGCSSIAISARMRSRVLVIRCRSGG